MEISCLHLNRKISAIEENLAASKWGKGRVQALCAWFEMKGRSEYSESPMEEETGEIEKSPVQ
ncbi:unnamed protein product [Haemonchus placei]|uniref:Uncharacterized protein n=1 Tax=Haemonchus placei TaxID=6290 RepID=A0A0N4X780_HAEPC|nr:unnamed protein product [Haemonchus placei]